MCYVDQHVLRFIAIGIGFKLFIKSNNESYCESPGWLSHINTDAVSLRKTLLLSSTLQQISSKWSARWNLLINIGIICIKIYEFFCSYVVRLCIVINFLLSLGM